jgi:hypothetical protein
MSKTHLRNAVCALILSVLPSGTPIDAKPIAQQCGALREVASLEMTALSDGTRVSVPLTINGKQVNLEVGTGAGMSSLTAAAAATLGIKLRDAVGTRLVDQDGTAIRHYYLADDFQLGPLAARKIPFMQGNDAVDARLSGTLGPDLMVRYDVEMDFSEQRLTYFSQDHCPGHILHWSSDAVTQVPIHITARARDYPPPAINPAAAGLSSDFVNLLMSFGSPILGTDIRTRIMLDGREFTANIDTGLDISAINSEAAQAYFNVPLDNPPANTPLKGSGAPVQTGAGTEAVTVTGYRRQHRFHALTFGGVTVSNPLFVLKPNPADAHRVGSPSPPDITIGMNVLRKLHLYFAFGERMLYVSAPGPELAHDRPGGQHSE